MPQTAVDPSTGNFLQVIEHTPMTFLGDVAFFTLAIYVADATGYSSLFLPVTARLESKMWQVLRMSALIGSYVEIRRWLEYWGWDTNLMNLLKGFF